MIIGIIYFHSGFGFPVFSFGVGHFISDLKDFLLFKFIGPDEEGEKKFWGID